MQNKIQRHSSTQNKICNGMNATNRIIYLKNNFLGFILSRKIGCYKKVCQSLIDKEQSVFIRGRYILESVVVAHEIVDPQVQGPKSHHQTRL
jgi:hypothetical protein